MKVRVQINGKGFAGGNISVKLEKEPKLNDIISIPMGEGFTSINVQIYQIGRGYGEFKYTLMCSKVSND